MKKELIVYGFGGFGREIAWLASEAGYKVVCFVDENPAYEGVVWSGIPINLSIANATKRFPDAQLTIAIGNPIVRNKVVVKLIDPLLATIIDPQVRMSNSVEVGKGTIICAGSILTVDIAIGQHTQINLDCTIGHDVIMGDYTTLAPGVHISGNVHIGKRVYIGTGAQIRNGTVDQPLIIGDDAVIGMGAVVVKNVTSNTTVVGNPAKPVPPN